MNQQTVKQETPIAPSFLTLPDGRKLAYCLSEGKSPGVVFLGGFKSDMTGTKAVALEAHCKAQGRRFLRFDYSGHGRSSGAFMDGTIGQWKRDALDMIDHMAPGHNILVGSSMGGWLMLLTALERKDRVAGLVGIASAPDFTQSLMEQEFSDAQREQMAREGVVYAPSCYGEEPYPITRQLIEDGRDHLLLGGQIALNMPVRLIHGMQDADVPWQVSVQLAQCLEGEDIRLHLVKNAGHRLSEPSELGLIQAALEDILP